MRRGFFMFLMLVLVLRGLTGMAMAAGVVPPLVPAGSHLQEPAHHHGSVEAQGTSSHHAGVFVGHVTLAYDAAEPCASGSEGCGLHADHAGTCSACEICHSAMLAPSAPSRVPPVPLDPMPPQGATTFHSAPAAPDIKPPIA